MPKAKKLSSVYETDPGVEFAGNVLSSTTDWVSRFVRIFHLVVAIIALVFSIMTLLSCDFLEYEFPPPIGASDVDIIDSSSNTNSSSALPDGVDRTPTFGLFKENPTGSVCTQYGDDHDPFAAHTASRLASAIATILGILALLLLLVEFLCCRFWCSRLIVILLLMVAGISQAFTLVLFLAEPCGGRNGDKYVCSLSQGGIESIVAAALFLLEAILTCCTPKSIPLLRVMRDMERLSVRDPCLFCCKGRSRDEVLEEQASLIEQLEQEELIDADTGAEGSPSLPEVTTKALPLIVASGADGTKYSQDRDSGTLTLQDQINASYDKWMKLEASYQRVLDRFKAEAGGAGLDWRELRSMNMENIAAVVEDYEVRRLWTLLNALEENTVRAKEDLEKFRAKLDRIVVASSVAAANTTTQEDATAASLWAR